MSREHELAEVDASWTLFLDRDGVLNRKLPGDYVKNIQEMEILPHVLESLYQLEPLFYKFIIVTNQQCIGKGIITESDLDSIHAYLIYEVKHAFGRVDAIYFCPHLEGSCHCRKPEIGMALLARQYDPQIDFAKSIMVGDSESDILFAKKCGMLSVKIVSTPSRNYENESKADIFVSSLYDFVKLLFKYKKL